MYNWITVSQKLQEFPAPLEVDRYLYHLKKRWKISLGMLRFRPLAREIGSYTKVNDNDVVYVENIEFSAPLEVDRELYLNGRKREFGYIGELEFPAPLEVDRELYERVSEDMDKILDGFRPLSR